MKTIIKQTVVRPDVALIWPLRIIAKLREALEIPIGYEDETGFHLGVQPVGTEVLEQPISRHTHEASAKKAIAKIFSSNLDDAVARSVADQIGE